MGRQMLASLHRYVGLYLACYLAIIGLAGSLCVYFKDIDHYLTPELHHIQPSGVRLDPATLIARAEKLAPQARVTDIILDAEESDATLIRMEPRVDALTGKPYTIDFTEIYLDPYSGEERGRRAFGDISQGLKNLMPFIYRFHYSLAMGTFGARLLGVSALIWTIDCFVGFSLTLPASAGKGGKARRSWLERWGLAWRVKFSASALRVFYGVHRAAGLWLWLLLLVFAWSSVSFNLRDEVYLPVMRMLFEFQEARKSASQVAMTATDFRPDWATALRRGREIMQDVGGHNGFKIHHESWLALDRAQGVYLYSVHSDLDIAASQAQTIVAFSAGNGSFVTVNAPSAIAAGDTVTNWFAALHKAEAFGDAYKIVVFLFGLGLTSLSLTGVYIWWKRLKARRSAQVDRFRRSASHDAPGSMSLGGEARR
jgi:uncharacterized iron-regulated membrane protein